MAGRLLVGKDAMLNTVNMPRRLAIKVVMLVLVAYTVVVTVGQALASQPSLGLYRERLRHTVASWYLSTVAPTIRFEQDTGFLNALQELRGHKLAHDYNNDLWEVNPRVVDNLPLAVLVPAYYEGPLPRPVVQPFDPRFTLAVYLRWLQQNMGLAMPFHWLDWVDTAKLDRYFLLSRGDRPLCAQLFDISGQRQLVETLALLNVLDYCVDDPDAPMGFRIVKFPGPQTIANHEVLSKAYLFLGFPLPVRVIFMTDSQGLYGVDVADHGTNDYRRSLLHNGLPEQVAGLFPVVQGRKQADVLASYRDLVQNSPPKNGDECLVGTRLEIPPQLFNGTLQLPLKPRDASITERSYVDAVHYSLAETNPPKYFLETKLLEKHPQKWLGEHYDWRFFNGLTVGKDEQILLLHRLIKNYLNFARQHGLVTWIAHGLLLLWYWNGMAFPWDTDIDVQMPIMDLHRLSRRFNQTLVVENVGNENLGFNGMGKYFIDVTSSITHRTSGNGNNNIDGRFIDVDTGLYIDITGLALTDTPAPPRYDHLVDTDPEKRRAVEHALEAGSLNHRVKNEQLQVYNCRNNHFSTHEELSPLLLGVVENQALYVPSNFVATLNYEYNFNSLTDKTYRDYTYLNNFRMWVKTQTILEYLDDPEAWLAKHNCTQHGSDDGSVVIRPYTKLAKKVAREVTAYDKVRIDNLQVVDHINLLQDNSIFREFVKIHSFTVFHEQELKHMLQGSMEELDANMEHYKRQHTLGGSLRTDLFMHRLFKNDWSFDEQVDRAVRLTGIYASPQGNNP